MSNKWPPLPEAKPLTIDPEEIDWSRALPDILVQGFVRTKPGANSQYIEIRPETGAPLVPSLQFFTGQSFATNEPFIEVEDLGGGVWSLKLIGPVSNSSTDEAVIHLRSDGVDQFDADDSHVFNIGGTEVFRIDTGYAGDWTTWTPTYTNFDPDDGTVVARYTQIGKTVIAHYEATLGTSPTVGTNPTFTLPVTASSSYTVLRNNLGPAYILDTGTTAFEGTVRLQSTTTVSVRVQTIGTTYLESNTLTSSVPMTWATGNLLSWTIVYEAA